MGIVKILWLVGCLTYKRTELRLRYSLWLIFYFFSRVDLGQTSQECSLWQIWHKRKIRL